MGRSEELTELDRLLDMAQAGSVGRLLVLGEPGIGKSALLSEFEHRARSRTATAVHVRGVEGERDVPFALLADWQRALGHRAASGGSVSGSRGDELLDQLIELCDVGLTTVVVDEAHYADGPSLDAVAMAVERLDQRRIVVVVAARPDLEVMRRFAEWPRMDVTRLSDKESVDLLRSIVGPDHSDPVLAAIASTLDGNPLALCQAPRTLTTAQLDGLSPLPPNLPIPAVLDHAWGSILHRLPPPTRRALLDVAVAGSRADLLASMAIASGWTDGHLAQAVEAGLLASDDTGAPRFDRRVVLAVVLGHASIPAVQDAHRRAAACARALDLPVRTVVDHLALSVSTSDESVADELEGEAKRAEESDQLWVASEAWQAAARLSTRSTLRTARALSGLRLIVENGLDYAGTDALLDLLSGEQLDAECACWVEWLRSLQRSDADPETAVTAQWTTIRRARMAAPGTLRGLLWDAALNAWSLGDTDAGLRAAREYAEVERTLDPAQAGVEPPWTGSALMAAGLFQSGEVAEAMQLRADAIHAAADVDPTTVPFDRLLSVVFLDDLLLDMSPESSDRLLVAEQRMNDEAAPLSCLCGIHAWRARARGDWTRAREILVEGRQLAAVTGAVGAQLGMAALAAELAGLGGEDAALHEEAARLRDRATRTGDRRRLATLDRALGLRALVDGRLDDAILFLTAAADVPFLGRGLRDAVLPSRVDLVEALVRRGDREAAQTRAADVAALLLAMDDPQASALASRAMALVKVGVAAETAYREALEAHERAVDPFERARTQLLLGEHLRRSRQRSAARPFLLKAAHTFDTLGAAPWSAVAHNELRAAGSRPGRPAHPTSTALLTAQERAVASSVASGKSNQEVADALFLSHRTVEYHLSSVYRKLGVRGRGDLAEVMRGESSPDRSSTVR